MTAGFYPFFHGRETRSGQNRRPVSAWSANSRCATADDSVWKNRASNPSTAQVTNATGSDGCFRCRRRCRERALDVDAQRTPASFSASVIAACRRSRLRCWRRRPNSRTQSARPQHNCRPGLHLPTLIRRLHTAQRAGWRIGSRRSDMASLQNTPMSSPKQKPETGEEKTKKIEAADFSLEVGKVNGEGEAPAQPRAPAWPLMRQLNG